MKNHYETAPQYSGKTYRVRGWSGIAFHVLGWETVPDEDTVWTGMEEQTGNVVAIMVGDNEQHSVDPADLSPLQEGEYCAECGQIGCTADGR